MIRNEENLLLSEGQINKLLPWFGYGFFKEADVVFLGNEEGLGRLPIQAVVARTKVFGNEKYTFLNGETWEGGYWDQSGKEGTIGLINETNKLRSELNLPEFKMKEEERYFPIIDFQSRIILNLEHSNENWFKSYDWYKSNDPNKLNIIKSCQDNLFSKERNIKAALVDWRPLPRSKEDVWPFRNIDENHYIEAFRLNKYYYNNVKMYNQNKLILEDTDKYTRMLIERINIIKKVVRTFKFPLLISSGDPNTKKRLFELILKDYNIKFERKELNDGKYYYRADVELENRVLTIILTLFFNHRKNCLQLEGLQELCETVINPITNKN